MMARRATSVAPKKAAYEPRHWRFNAEQYQLMGQVGIFHKEDRVELLRGEIYEMTPIGSWHGGGVDSLNMNFAGNLSGRAIVRVQGSFRIAMHSEPQPDLLVLKYRADYYKNALPGPEDVLLLVEVAETSLRYDREFKLPLYADANVPEVWIINHPEQRLEVYREPREGRYQSVSVHERGSVVASLAFPDLTV